MIRLETQSVNSPIANLFAFLFWHQKQYKLNYMHICNPITSADDVIHTTALVSLPFEQMVEFHNLVPSEPQKIQKQGSFTADCQRTEIRLSFHAPRVCHRWQQLQSGIMLQSVHSKPGFTLGSSRNGAVACIFVD